MTPIQIDEKVTWLGVDDRETDLFEGLWSIRKSSVSYNSYLIRAGKNVLVDIIGETAQESYFKQLHSLIDPAELDYVVINHMEPDHTGALQALLKLAPQVTLLVAPRAVEMLQHFYNIRDQVQVVKDGETLSLGEDTLRFIHTPFVHWPETMMTYLEGSAILFSCDAFGGYGVVNGKIFDYDHSDLTAFESEAQRYFFTVVSLFSKPVIKAIKKLGEVPIKMVAPSHGLIWKKNPDHIIELYSRWANYTSGPAENGVTVLIGSMYGNTRRMLESVLSGLQESGITYRLFDVVRDDLSEMLTSIWSQQGVMIGAPTYEGNLFPPVSHILENAGHKRIRNRKVARFGSYGWNAAAQQHYEKLIEPMHWNQMGVLEFRGAATDQELAAGQVFGREFGQAVMADYS